MPVDEPTLALPLLLLHVPPAGVEFNVVVAPTHTFSVPVIAVGFGFTVTGVVTVQTPPIVLVIVDVPAIAPVTTPVTGFIVAFPLLLLHTPPAGVVFNVVVKPTHTFVVPVIVVGCELTVTTVVLIQPVFSVYVIIAVPASAPESTPLDDPMVALALLLLHVPPAGVEFNVDVAPVHMFVVPVIVVGLALTVTGVVT